MTLYKEMGKHSYRELPMRFSEFATLYRYEKSGELNGLTRVRSLTQDDCHTFCTEDQIEEEFTRNLQLIQEVLDRYKFTDYKVDLSLKGDEGKYVDDDEKWNKATAALRSALEKNGIATFQTYWRRIGLRSRDDTIKVINNNAANKLTNDETVK